MKKNSLLISISTLFAFFLIAIFGGTGLKAADCPSLLNISCNTSATQATDNVSSTVSTYLGYDMSLYDATKYSANDIRLTLGSQEKYPTMTYDDNNVILNKFGVYYYYTYGSSRDWSGMVGQVYVRGQNAIIFQDLNSTMAYNQAYTYKYCKKKSWGKCKEWSSQIVTDIYDKKTDPSAFSVKDGALTYTKLDNVPMVLPSFQVNTARSSSMTVYSKAQGKNITVWNMHGEEADWITFAGDTVYNSDGTLKYGRGCFMDYCTDVNSDQRTQVLMTTLVMVYQAKVTFYYLKSNSNGVATFGTATTTAKVYVTYTMASGASHKTMQALNGYLPTVA